jgi:hypothetical protein
VRFGEALKKFHFDGKLRAPPSWQLLWLLQKRKALVEGFTSA